MERTSLNNGVPFKDYEDPINSKGSYQEDLVYTSMLHSDADNNPIDVYTRLKEETLAQGYSITVNEAKMKWKEEQDFTNSSVLQNIIEDPIMDVKNKKTILDSYIKTGIVSNDLKDSIIEKMSNKYILDNNLDENDDAIEEVDLVVREFKLEQQIDKLKDNVKVFGSNTQDVTVESAVDQAEKVFYLIGGKEKEKGDFAKFLATKPAGYNYGVEAEIIFWKDMIVGKGPEWISTMAQVLSNRLSNLIATEYPLATNLLKHLITSKYIAQIGLDSVIPEVDKRTWTELRNDIEEQQKGSWTREWSENAAAALEDWGYSPRLLNEATLSGKLFTSIGEGLEWIGKTFSPEDPQKLIVPLEIAIPFSIYGVGKGANYVYNKYTTKKGKNKEGIHESATDIQRDAVRAENKRQQDIAASKERARQKKENILPAPQKEGTIIPKEKIVLKATDPITTLLVSNNKAANNIIDAVILDGTGQIGDAVGLTRDKFIMQMTNPSTEIIKKEMYGWSNDMSRVKQLEMQAAIDRLTNVDRTTLSDKKQLDKALDQVVMTYNGLVREVPMVIGRSFAEFKVQERLTRTAKGVILSIPFIRSPNEFYKANEAVPALRQVEESINNYFLAEKNIVEPGEVFIQEVDMRGNEINRFTQESFPLEPNPTSNFIIRWEPDTNLYDSTQGNLGNLPSDRFNTGRNIAGKTKDKINKYLFDTDVTPTSTGGVNWFAKYGRYSKDLERQSNMTQLEASVYLRKQSELVEATIKKQLTNEQQLMLGKLMEAGDTYGIVNWTSDLVYEHLGFNPELSYVRKMQESLNMARILQDSMYQARAELYLNDLNLVGITRGFFIAPRQEVQIYESLQGPTVVMPVQETFAVTPTETPLLFTEEGVPVTSMVYDFVTQKKIAWTPNPANQNHFLLEKNMPTRQVYRLGRNHVIRNKNGINEIFQFGTFDLLNSVTLPNNTFPKREGGMTKEHLESYAITYVPSRLIINGRELSIPNVDYGPRRIIDLDKKKLTKLQYDNRVKAIKIMENFTETSAMVDSPREGYSWSRKNIEPTDLSAFYYLRKTKDLSIADVADWRLREQEIASPNLRNQSLDSQLASDPLATMLKNAKSLGKKQYETVANQQLKNEWWNTYGNAPELTIAKNPQTIIKEVQGVDSINVSGVDTNFPITVTQIKAKTLTPLAQEIARQAVAEWQMIDVREYGTNHSADTKAVVKFIRNKADALGNLTENKKMLSYVTKKTKLISRSPAEASNALLKATTTMQIMVHIFKQLPLQAMAPMANLMTVDPLHFMSNLKQAFAILSLKSIQSKELAAGKLDLMAVHDYLYAQDGILNSELGQTLKEDRLKLTQQEMEVFLKAFESNAIGAVGDHLFTQGIMMNELVVLGRGKSKTAQFFEFLTKYGFEFGELISRVGHGVAALRLYQKNQLLLPPGTPRVPWKSNEGLKIIMYDAYQFSGSMTAITKFKWQNSIFFRTVAQFKSFGAAMAEGAINANATPFTGKQRIKAQIWHQLMYGSMLFGVVEWQIEKLKNSGSETQYDIAEFLEINGIDFVLNNTLDALMYLHTGEWGDSEVRYGKTFSLYGNGEDRKRFQKQYGDVLGAMLAETGALTWVVPTIRAAILKENLDIRDYGASIGFLAKATNLPVQLWEIWVRNPEAYGDEAFAMSAKELAQFFPWAKGTVNIIAEFEHGHFTKSGHPTGISRSSAEIIMTNFFGFRDKKTEHLWTVGKSESELRKSAKGHALNFLRLLSSKQGGGTPDWLMTQKALKNYKLMIGSRNFLPTDEIHDLFVSTVMSGIARQDTPMTNNIMKGYIQSIIGTDEEVGIRGEKKRQIRDMIESSNMKDDEKEALKELLYVHKSLK